jgi:hypothetical protein
MDAKKVEYYLEKNNVPQNTLHKQDCRYWLCAIILEQFLKMRILEPEDGGGVESQRVRITSKNKPKYKVRKQ